MRSGSMVVPTIIVSLLILGGLAWLIPRDSTPSKNPPTPKATTEDGVPKDAPELATSGPYPKAVVEESEHDFGAMAFGYTRSHDYVIRNEGEAPLKIVKGETTCSCTIPELKDGEVPPGGSVKITLTWTPKSTTQTFEQRATMWTNDPENRKIVLSVKGIVDELISLQPSSPWNMQTISTEKPTVVKGFMFTRLQDSFQITDILVENPLVKVESQPMTEDQLENTHARSGYELTVTVDPAAGKLVDENASSSADLNKLGEFRQEVTVKTDIKDLADQHFEVTGQVEGPLEIRPLLQSGAIWHSQTMLLAMGNIASNQEKVVTLQMNISELGEQPMEILEVKSDPEFLQVSVEPDPDYFASGEAQYIVKITVPEDHPAVVRGFDNPGKITIRTNHPRKVLQEITFKVAFFAL